MTKIKPFKAIRPTQELAAKVATLPYDVVNDKEVRQFKNDEYNFYHVTRSEIDLSESVDVHSSAVYEKAKENLHSMLDEGILFYEEEPCYYIYTLEMDGRQQTGLVCGSSLEDYNEDLIKKHEFTRPEKELDRIQHIKATKVHSGVVFLAYRDQADVQKIIADWKAQHAATYDFTAEDGIRHTVWVVNEYAKIAQITSLFASSVPCTYIADGHHRAASAAKVAAEMDENGMSVTGDENFHYFLTAIFPESELKILDYNRAVKDLNGLSTSEFISKLSEKFDVVEKGTETVKPEERQKFGLYVDKNWYELTAKQGTFSTDNIGILDVSILQKNVLSEILEIHDPRTDKRIEFVGGIRGMKGLMAKVDSGDFVAAFSLYPVSIQQLFAVADSGQVMPPKSTWFEPKLRDGLIVYPI